MNKLREQIKDILFFQSEPMSSNMLADWQVDQATKAIYLLINQKEKESKLNAYLEIDLLIAEQEQRYETLEYAELHNDLEDRIKQLKEELKGGTQYE